MPDSANPPAPAPAPRKGGLIGKLMIGGGVVLVIAVEVLVTWLLVPSAEDVADLAEQRLMKKLQLVQLQEGDEFPAVSESGEVEVDLGTYSITHKNGTAVMRIDIGLAGTVLQGDQAEFEDLKLKVTSRLSHLIIVEVRNAEPVDLYDPELGLIRRRILEKSNVLFGKPLLRQVLVKDFSIIEH